MQPHRLWLLLLLVGLNACPGRSNYPSLESMLWKYLLYVHEPSSHIHTSLSDGSLSLKQRFTLCANVLWADRETSESLRSKRGSCCRVFFCKQNDTFLGRHSCLPISLSAIVNVIWTCNNDDLHGTWLFAAHDVTLWLWVEKRQAPESVNNMSECVVIECNLQMYTL